MGLWEELKEALTGAEKRATTEVGKRAARATLDRLGDRAEAMSEGFVADLEARLAAAEGARSGQPTGPAGGSAEEIAARVVALAEEASVGAPPPEEVSTEAAPAPVEAPEPPAAPPSSWYRQTDAQRKAAALEELARLKAARSAGPGESDPAKKRTL